MKVNKTFGIDAEIVEQLEEEDNQTAVVEAALRNYYDIQEST